jgi:hypothetical protein
MLCFAAGSVRGEQSGRVPVGIERFEPTKDASKGFARWFRRRRPARQRKTNWLPKFIA